jgi:hypothetical protein
VSMVDALVSTRIVVLLVLYVPFIVRRRCVINVGGNSLLIVLVVDWLSRRWWPSVKCDMCCSIGDSAEVETGLEHYTLAVAFASPFTLDTVPTNWTLLAALDAAFATGKTSCFCSFPGEFGS